MNTIKEMVNNSAAVLVDVRSPWEYEEGHLPGAVNIPLETVTGRVDEFKSFTRPVVVYCRSGARSGMAVQLLQQHGVTGVYNGGAFTDIQLILN